MTVYLEQGWYLPGVERALRPEIVDAAMDMAGFLRRMDVSALEVQHVALKVRSMVTIIARAPQFGDRERHALLCRLQDYTQESPALEGFITDCLEHIAVPTDLFALYLHLVHVARMMDLLVVTAPTEPPAAVKKKAVKKKAVKKKR